MTSLTGEEACHAAACLHVPAESPEFQPILKAAEGQLAGGMATNGVALYLTVFKPFLLYKWLYHRK